MIGNNHMTLNPAIVMEALQEYFDKRASGLDIKVVSIRMRENSFEVAVTAKGALPGLVPNPMHSPIAGGLGT